MSDIRVLHVGKFYPPASGGMEKVVQTLCEGERARGVDSRVLAANHGGMRTLHEEHRAVPVTRVATLATIGSVGLCPTFPLWMRHLDADVMVIHEPNPLALVSHALARPRARLLVWFHSEVVRPRWKYRAIYRPMLRRVLTLADRILVSSPRLAECAEELHDFREKCVSVPFGVDPNQHAVSDANRTLIHELRAAGPEPLLLFVGRMVPYKGVDVLLKALVGVKARAVLVGDGPMRMEWQRLATSLGLDGRVRFAGEVGPVELAAHYQACDVFVLPSVTRAEAFGMVQIEAMACGKPVVSTRLPSGVPWVNQDGETGIVVEPSDVGALEGALNALVNDPALRARLGTGARARVLSTFTVPGMIDRTTALYQEVTQVPRPATRLKRAS